MAYVIVDREDLYLAISSWSRAYVRAVDDGAIEARSPDLEVAKAHIIERAFVLGLGDDLPIDWLSSTTKPKEGAP